MAAVITGTHLNVTFTRTLLALFVFTHYMGFGILDMVLMEKSKLCFWQQNLLLLLLLLRTDKAACNKQNI
jgi:hypothetical protein